MREEHIERQRNEGEKTVEKIQVKEKTGKSHEGASASCDRDRPPLRDVESGFTASKSNTQRNVSC